MPNNNLLLYLIIGVSVLFIIILLMYLSLRKKMQASEIKQIQELRAGTQERKFSSEVIYQKLYITYLKIPFLKRYLLKI